MSWSAPKTMGAEAGVSSDWNTYVRDNLNYLKGITDGVTFSGTQVTRTAATSTTTATYYAVVWSAEVFDYGGWWASGTNIVVPAGAIPSGYTTIALLISARTRWAANGTGSRRLRILKNGSEIDAVSVSAITGDTTEVALVSFVTAVAADVITVESYQSSGGALNISSSQISVVRFAPAA